MVKVVIYFPKNKKSESCYIFSIKQTWWKSLHVVQQNKTGESRTSPENKQRESRYMFFHKTSKVKAVTYFSSSVISVARMLNY